MRTDNGPGIHMRAGLLASSVPLTPRLRLCPSCVAADWQAFGVCYWHRVHQLTGVVLCPIHAEPLVETTISPRHQQTHYRFISAERALHEPLQTSDDTWGIWG